ncbi:MAG: hypothetical protein V4664_02430 [Patescibacteria group bacterium]
MLRQSLASLVQKIGLSLSFVYATLIAFFRPIEATSYYPRLSYWSTDITALVGIGGFLSLVMAVWIISNRKKFLANLIATALLSLAILINITKLHFILSVTPVLALALSLTIRYYPRVRVIGPNPPISPIA